MRCGVIESEEINYRVDFPLLCNARGVRVAVEVGTDRGVFARQFMERFQGEELLCVDEYVKCDEFPFERTADMSMALRALEPWHGRVRFIEEASVKAAEKMFWWMTGRIDFIYIDGAHDYQSVSADLEAWWQLLSPEGIIAGHDYDESHTGVVEAVKDFAARWGLIIRLVRGDVLPSWYAYKNEPTNLIKRYFSKENIQNPYVQGSAESV